MSLTFQEYLDFSKDTIPTEKVFSIDGVEYRITVDYNEYGDFYTIIFRDSNKNILLTNKLTYFSYLNNAVVEGLDIVRKLVPINYSDIDTDLEINADNFSKIGLYFVDVT